MYWKKAVHVAVLLLLVAILVACSSSDEKDPTTTSPPPPTDVPPTATLPPPPPTDVPPTATLPPPPPTDAPGTDMPEADGMAILDYVLDAMPYTGWGTWPADQWNDFSGFLNSGAPHGNVVRVFVNDVALEATQVADFDGILPPGSIVLKENYPGTDPADPGDLAALTIMYKVDGFNPEANDWYWVKAAGDGSAVDAEGAVGGCIGCHSQEGHADYLLRYAFGQEPAVTSLETEPSEPEPEPEADIRPPQELYFDIMECDDCHDIDQPEAADNIGGYAPNQGNLYETAGDRVEGQDAETYVYESIVNPSAFILEGYDDEMPGDFADLMSEEEIRALVAWLLNPDRER